MANGIRQGTHLPLVHSVEIAQALQRDQAVTEAPAESLRRAETYPTDNWGTTESLSYTFDSMGRLNTMTDNIGMTTLISGATYGPANELLTITSGLGGWGSETRTYNSLKQLVALGTPGIYFTYNYPATGNNGKITSEVDGYTGGETITYAYDSLNRLISASSSASWSQTFTYDGFSNLTATVGVNAPGFSGPCCNLNNQDYGEDANGNPWTVQLPAYGTSASASYDIENRLVSLSSGSSYSYDPSNRRVWRGTWYNSSGTWTRGQDEVTFWSISGRKLAAYNITSSYGFYATQIGFNYYFGAKLIQNGYGNDVYTNRLGSVGTFYPYGVERGTVGPNDTEKFTGYFRDSESGNDYAVNRYQSPGYGRFLTPDQGGNPSAADPGSWNKYAYTRGDPVNRADPGGMDDCPVQYCMSMNVWVDTPDAFAYTGTGGGGTDPMLLFTAEETSGSPCYGEGSNITQDCIDWLTGFAAQAYGSGDQPPAMNMEGTSAPTAIKNVMPLVSGIFNTLSTVLSGTSCGNWFSAGLAVSGNGQFPGQSLSDFLSNFLPQFVGRGDFVGGNSNSVQGSSLLPSGYTIAVNNQGAFFNAVPNGQVIGGGQTYGAAIASINGGSVQAQAFLMLHEVAHLFGMIQDDSNDPTMVAHNNDLIWQNCGNVLGTLSNKGP